MQCASFLHSWCATRWVWSIPIRCEINMQYLGEGRTGWAAAFGKMLLQGCVLKQPLNVEEMHSSYKNAQHGANMLAKHDITYYSGFSQTEPHCTALVLVLGGCLWHVYLFRGLFIFRRSQVACTACVFWRVFACHFSIKGQQHIQQLQQLVSINKSKYS